MKRQTFKASDLKKVEHRHFRCTTCLQDVVLGDAAARTPKCCGGFCAPVNCGKGCEKCAQLN